MTTNTKPRKSTSKTKSKTLSTKQPSSKVTKKIESESVADSKTPIFALPLDKLSLDPVNPRKQRQAACPLLCANIAKKGQLQNIGVRPNPDREGHFLVTFGGRRLAAMNALAEKGTLETSHPVMCRMGSEDDGEAYEEQIAENLCRKAMHPMDEFEAFHRLHSLGWDAERIASHYGTVERVIQDRLALGGAAASVRDSYRDGCITLEVVKAYAGCPDVSRQERVFRDLFGSPDRGNIHAIQRTLYQSAIDSDDDLARFVGLDAYQKAGGEIETDLLSDEVKLTDLELLSELRDGIMKDAITKIVAEGWKWADASDQPLHTLCRGQRKLEGTPTAKSEDDQRRLLEIECIFEDLEGTPLSKEETEECRRLSEEYDTLASIEYNFTPEQKAIGGCYAVLEGDTLFIYEGYVRRQDEPKADEGSTPSNRTPELDTTTVTIRTMAANGVNQARSGASADQLDKPSAVQNRHDRNVSRDIANYRAQTLRSVLIDQPELACRISEFTICLQVFTGEDRDHLGSTLCAEAFDLHSSADDIDHTPASKRLADARAKLPTGLFDTGDLEAMFQNFIGLNDVTRTALVGFAYGQTIEPNDNDQNLLARLAANWNIRYRDHFTPTTGNYFNRVAKPVLFEALDECLGKSTRLQATPNNTQKVDVVQTIADHFDDKRIASDEARENMALWVPIGFRFDDA